MIPFCQKFHAGNVLRVVLMQDRIHEKMEKAVCLGKDMDKKIPRQVWPEHVKGRKSGFERHSQFIEQILKVC